MSRPERVVVARRQVAPGIRRASLTPLNELEDFGLKVLRQLAEDFRARQLDVL